jgi:hypothetical protein
MKKSRGNGRPGNRATVADGLRKRSVLATSETARRVYAERRGKPLVLGDDVKLFGHTKLTYKQLLDLKIDPTYQREEVTPKVNELIHVIRSGGMIPDPISVAIRTDGSRYIVDGQQRWWASVDCETPLEAKLFKVASYEAEVTLFNVLNNNAVLGSRVRVRAWPGTAGDVLRRLNEGSSPLAGRINFKADSSVAFPAVAVLRGLTAALTGTMATGGSQKSLQQFDFHYDKNPVWSRAVCDAYAEIAASIFDDGSHVMRSLVAVALGRVCYERWVDANPKQPLPMPSVGALAKLRKVDWGKLVPSASTKWLPVLENEFTSVWR